MLEQNATPALPQSEWTEIIIERPLRGGKTEKITLRVPFSAKEVEEIQHASQEMKFLKDEALRGSSWIRSLYVDYNIPCGGQ